MNEENKNIEEPNESVGPAADAADIDTLTQLRTENEQLRATIRHAEAHRQITAELTAAGAASPELLFASIRGDLQFADDKVVNLAALVGKLQREYPEQFSRSRPASIDAGSGTSNPQGLTRRSLAQMSADEIAKLDWADVSRALAGDDSR